MIAILKREFKSYMHNVSGFIFIAFLLVFVGFFTAAQNLFGGSASFGYALYNVVIVFLLIVPILTMRAIAEEKHTQKDIDTLFKFANIMTAASLCGLGQASQSALLSAREHFPEVFEIEKEVAIR